VLQEEYLRQSYLMKETIKQVTSWLEAQVA